jgi:hypothetical protein
MRKHVAAIQPPLPAPEPIDHYGRSVHDWQDSRGRRHRTRWSPRHLLLASSSVRHSNYRDHIRRLERFRRRLEWKCRRPR